MKSTILLFAILILAFAILFGSHPNLDVEAQEENRSPNPNLPNYDIRTDNRDEAADALLRFRQASSKTAVSVASVRDSFVTGEESLKQKVPSLKVEYNDDLRIPEVIGSDVKQEFNFLSGGSNAGRSEILRSFIKENSSLLGVIDVQADQLELTADDANPEGNLSFVRLEQKINNVPVFRGEIKAAFTKKGELIRVINNLAPGLNYERLSTDFRNPEDAVRAAFRQVTREIETEDTRLNAAESTDLKAKFGSGDWATTAEKIYFPTEPGVAVPAWRVNIWQDVNAYMVIVDAETGVMLWRKNATEEQTQSATYNVYTAPNGMLNLADSPAPLSPGPTIPGFGTQGIIESRSNVTRVGNEAPYTFNNNGWITDGNNTTDGNAVEAGLDRSQPNGVDAAQVGFPNRVFTSNWNPPPGNPAPGDDPLTPQAQRGSVIQMFYIMNVYHDEMYRLGFTEPFGNFQHNNFGRGGVGNDRISAESQDRTPAPFSCPPCFNNANFSTLPDGQRGRMQMYLWNGPTPDRDGAADAEIVIHEATHGTTNRLIGNASGLTTNMSKGLGEGWSDFYALAMLSRNFEQINSIYAMGGYSTHLASPTYTSNYYYGIRRFPKAVKGFTGANGKPHNPLTFRYLNAGCDDLIGTSSTNPNSAFPRNPVFAQPDASGGPNCDQVHNAGEIWSSALWEVRAKVVARLGWTEGNRRILKIVTEAMKFTPLNPTFLQARDAIIVAAKFNGELADVADIWEGFRLRGMGLNASIQNTGTGKNDTVVTENFSPATITVKASSPSFSFTATAGGANPANGFLSISSPDAFTIKTTMSDNADWLTVTQSSIISSAANISVNIAGLAVGTHNANIRVDVPGATNSPLNIPVTLTVKPEPLTLNVTGLSFTGIAGGGNVPNQFFSITNSSGSGPLNFNISDDANWLNVSPANGNLPQGSTALAIVSVNSAGLSGGVHNGKISISAGGVTKVVNVSFNFVSNPPVISVNPTGLSLVASVGAPNPSTSLNIKNTGSGTLKWTTFIDAGWLSITPTNANLFPGASVPVRVFVNIAGLSVGTHSANISITAPNAAKVTVPVEITITPPTQ